MAIPTNDQTLEKNLAEFAQSLFEYCRDHYSDVNAHRLATSTTAGFISPLYVQKIDEFSQYMNQEDDYGSITDTVAETNDYGFITDAVS